MFFTKGYLPLRQLNTQNLHTMSKVTFKTRQVDVNAFEVVMHGTPYYPVSLNTYTTREKAEDVANKLAALDL